MSRGAAGAAQKSLATTNAIGSDEQKRANALQDKTTPGYTNLMNTGYLNPAEEGAATTSEMGAATAPFESAKFDANNTAAATHNASDLTANQDQLALSEGRIAGDTAAGLQKQKMQNQQAGMYGLNQQSAQDQNASESMYGLAPSTVNAWSQAQMNNPMLNTLNTVISAGGQAAGGAMAKGCWVAAEFYGWNTPEWTAIRNFVYDTWWMRPFAKFYTKFGKRWAEVIAHRGVLRDITQVLFAWFLKKARA